MPPPRRSSARRRHRHARQVDDDRAGSCISSSRLDATRRRSSARSLPTHLSGTRSAATARLGSGPEVVVEADEYAGNFDPYEPAIGAVVTAEWDHPDVFSDETAVVDAIASWVERFDRAGDPPVLVANVGDHGVRRLLERLADWRGRLTTVELVGGQRRRTSGPAFGHRARPGATDRRPHHRQRHWRRGSPRRWHRGGASHPGPHQPGRYVTWPSTASWPRPWPSRSASVRRRPSGRWRPSQESGAGSSSRATSAGIVVLDDYAHHPTAMRLTFEAVRQRYPGRPICGRSTSRSRSTVRRPCSMPSPTSSRPRIASRSSTSGRCATRHDDRVSAEDLARRHTGPRGRLPSRAAVPRPAPSGWPSSSSRVTSSLVMGGGRSYVVAEQLVERLRLEAEPRASSAVSAGFVVGPSGAA